GRTAGVETETDPPCRLLGFRRLQASTSEAVGIAGRVTALQSRLVHPQPTKLVAVREEATVGHQTAGKDVGVEFGHPRADAPGIEHLVPRSVERVGDVDAPAVAADLHHLRPAAQRHVWHARMRLAPHDPAEPHRRRLLRVKWVADVELLEFTCRPTGYIQPTVVDGEVDV